MVKDKLVLAGPRLARGLVQLPGSKSISNRALLLAALAKGPTRLSNVLLSDDTRRMLTALSALGVRVQQQGTDIIVEGQGGRFCYEGELLVLDLGNAGTAMRPLTAILAGSQGQFLLTGEARMFERPIGPLVATLKQLGADIAFEQAEGYPPLKIHGKNLRGGTCQLDGSLSSQYISALLMLLPLLDGNTELELTGQLVSWPYVEITLAMMKQFGIVGIEVQERKVIVPGNQSYLSPEHYHVESDASSASYFLAAAAMSEGRVTVEGVGKASLQGDIHFADVLEQMGAKVSYGKQTITVVGNSNGLKGGDFDLNHIPDAAMTIAVAAVFAKEPTTIRNIGNWRIKETDRLFAMATELRKVGCVIVEGEDFISIEPPEHHRFAEIETYNDHRMAMCFSLLALREPGICILDPSCCSKTYPQYFEDFGRICAM
ncbi:MAG: 3-phosphoshikimate 1-carboxyvinyltransferase AroA [Idiomarinaceae bacterium HL-53]|nr:MAG: 3-phosphoshikimate 1-carboxyvinyltransferase AroA [Idiomarinaceae bacterium HL-53]CUS48927.1 3-phosphoshikimate 1-carboxyvinyltransferase [Idiomarinaceae bacterium HL-53]